MLWGSYIMLEKNSIVHLGIDSGYPEPTEHTAARYAHLILNKALQLHFIECFNLFNYTFLFCTLPVTTAWRVPWFADGGVGHRIWRLAANILNKQSWISTRSGPPDWGIGVRLTCSHCKNHLTSETSHRPRNWQY